MLEVKDIEKLAKLARIELTEEEKQTLLKEVDPILNYVAQLKEVSAKVKTSSAGSTLRLTEDLITPSASRRADLPKVGEHRNVMREDEVKNESGGNTDILVSEFPDKQGNSLKVKKIL
jgi:aspartyl-tRNA(Asn)/glutamyl-tRNA(Gln) amidotransferase subunit C